VINVLYHGPDCLDGFTAAWAVKIKHPDALLHPINYNETPPTLQKGILYIVDFTFAEIEIMRDYIRQHLIVIHYDHHETSGPTMALLDNEFGASGRYISVHNQSKSGAGITWDQLFSPNPRPKLINYIEDRDLWKFKYKHTKAFTEGLLTLNKTIENWNFAFGPEGRKLLIKIGNERLGDRLERCERQAKRTTVMHSLEITDALSESVPISMVEDPIDTSDQIEQMLKLYPESEIVGCQFPLSYTETKVRLGSRKDGPSVARVALRYGGGGHTHAASFVIGIKRLAELVV
jgi:uncharacterized protein